MDAESLIFDIDGTLWDSREIVGKAFTERLDQLKVPHVPITVELLTSLFGKVIDALADAIMPSVPVPERHVRMQQTIDHELQYMDAVPCDYSYPKIRETMEKLSRNHRIFIVSNSEQGYPQLCTRKLKLEPFVSGTLCYGDTGTSKGQTILQLMREHKITRAVYIGDTQGDYEAALEAGIPFVWAAYGFGNPERWDAKINTFSQLTEIF